MGLFDFLKPGKPEKDKPAKNKDLDGLLLSLLDKDPKTRQLAAHSLIGLADGKSIPALMTALKDDDADVRKWSICALGEIKAAEAVGALIELLNDPDQYIPGFAAEALGKIADSKAVEPLIRILEEPDMELFVKLRTVEALAKIKNNRAKRALFSSLKDKPDKWARQTIDNLEWTPEDDYKHVSDLISREKWDELVDLGEPAVTPLIQLLFGGDHHSREKAAETLGRIKDSNAVEPLVHILTDNSNEKFVSFENKVIDALVNIGIASVPVLTRFLESKNQHSLNNIAETLGRIKDPNAVGPLEDSIKRHFIPDKYRDQRILALEKIGKPSIHVFIELLKNDMPRLRAEAANSLGNIGDESVEDHLKTLLKDPDLSVQEASAKALRKIRYKNELK